MSFYRAEYGRGFSPGWFLESETGLVRKTRMAVPGDPDTGAGYLETVPMGAIWPSNDEQAEGFVYEDTDVSGGSVPMSLVVAGRVYMDRLPEVLSQEAVSALEAKGFIFIANSPAVERPD